MHVALPLLGRYLEEVLVESPAPEYVLVLLPRDRPQLDCVCAFLFLNSREVLHMPVRREAGSLHHLLVPLAHTAAAAAHDSFFSVLIVLTVP